MKALIAAFSIGLAFAATAFADNCPDLSGTYICQDAQGHKAETRFSQLQVDGHWEYTIQSKGDTQVDLEGSPLTGQGKFKGFGEWKETRTTSCIQGVAIRVDQALNWTKVDGSKVGQVPTLSQTIYVKSDAAGRPKMDGAYIVITNVQGRDANEVAAKWSRYPEPTGCSPKK